MACPSLARGEFQQDLAFSRSAGAIEPGGTCAEGELPIRRQSGVDDLHGAHRDAGHLLAGAATQMDGGWSIVKALHVARCEVVALQIVPLQVLTVFLYVDDLVERSIHVDASYCELMTPSAISSWRDVRSHISHAVDLDDRCLYRVLDALQRKAGIPPEMRTGHLDKNPLGFPDDLNPFVLALRQQGGCAPAKRQDDARGERRGAKCRFHMIELRGPARPRWCRAVALTTGIIS